MAAAIEALAEVGEAGVAIEPLARRLSVTKGSFYHHFTDRDHLWTAVLQAFEQDGTDAIVAMTGAIPDPRERLSSLFAAAFDRPEHLRATRALLGSRRPDVAACLARVHDRRRAWLAQCYRELGSAPDVAEGQAATAYALYLGVVQLADQPPFAHADSLHRWVSGLGRFLLP